MPIPRFAPRWRVACLAGIVAVTSLLAACGSTGPSQPGTTPPPAPTSTALLTVLPVRSGQGLAGMTP